MITHSSEPDCARELVVTSVVSHDRNASSEGYCAQMMSLWRVFWGQPLLQVAKKSSGFYSKSYRADTKPFGNKVATQKMPFMTITLRKVFKNEFFCPKMDNWRINLSFMHVFPRKIWKFQDRFTLVPYKLLQHPTEFQEKISRGKKFIEILHICKSANFLGD